MAEPATAPLFDTVLVVDDNRQIRAVVKAVIGPLVRRVIEASNGAGALTQYAAEHPDLVLMDVRMPGPDGLSTSAELMRLHPEARIVMVTEDDDDESREKAREAGARGFLVKNDLIALRELLEQLAREK